MWDFDLQLRFAKSMSDAFFGVASMAIGAASEVQQKALQSIDERPTPRVAEASPFDPFGAFGWWPAFFPQDNFTTALPVPSAFTWPGVFPAMPFWPGLPSPVEQNRWTAAMTAASGFQQMAANNMAGADMIKSFWPAAAWQPFTWTMYKWPMTAMMISAGVPHAVASPAADAGMATMDAVDCAREQASLMFAFFGGDTAKATAPSNVWPLGPMALFDYLPWYTPSQGSPAA